MVLWLRLQQSFAEVVGHMIIEESLFHRRHIIVANITCRLYQHPMKWIARSYITISPTTCSAPEIYSSDMQRRSGAESSSNLPYYYTQNKLLSSLSRRACSFLGEQGRTLRSCPLME